MRGRFQASRSPAEVARWFETSGLPPNVRERYNAAPTPTHAFAAQTCRISNLFTRRPYPQQVLTSVTRRTRSFAESFNVAAVTAVRPGPR